jgi:hypothetical protein
MSNRFGTDFVDQYVIEKIDCDHGVKFNLETASSLDAFEVRKKYPRLCGFCPLGCGYSGIAYASSEHYYLGDW